ncbi:MAG: DUF3604 domain-containing protein [Proteobacteria bacterium]|nr:DUF3604 domain-containing protein [Pseudomonadota bacterium]
MKLKRLARALALAALAAGPADGAKAGDPEGSAAPHAVELKYREQREACADRNPLRNAYFGELHVHTGFSTDAYTFETRTTPDDAYAFAKGEPIPFAGGRRVSLERPLDFTAVTDHASFLGEGRLCTSEDSPVYDSEPCVYFRGEQSDESGPLGGMGRRLAAITGGGVGTPARSAALCGEDFERCLAAMDSVWKENQAAAERHYDRTAECRFTSFNGYEYTATPDYAKVHRNVIFRGEAVPERVVAWVDEPNVWELWRRLRSDCLDAGNGCDALTIPHNSNMSNGQMFALDYFGEPRDRQVAMAELRARLEPLIEIMQTKGDSECRNGMWKVLGDPDPLCDFEKWRLLEPAPEDCEKGTGRGGVIGEGCQSRVDFARYALVEGLREAGRIGVNPIKFGMTASTDVHNGNSGDTEEASFDGLLGISDATPGQRLMRGTSTALPPAAFNPGGLVGVWAEENSRDALFDAMKRRETFGTSGTRILPRLFGGWTLDPALCADPALLQKAYAQGVPMGSDLSAPPEGAAAPRFLVSALRDPGGAGIRSLPLQRIQIVKAWPGEDDAIHQAVFDVAGNPDNGAGVDPETCEPQGAGDDTLCAVWTDPDFDPDSHAVYYARVLENPSCRWSTLQCNQFSEEDRPESCAHPQVSRAIQERAWTSPIWFVPR